ncbi:hypothetical protein [Campylobacter sp. MG1]|uniref:hypothetical protein n=1 Tax=Campylobacter sp. MG1 TaxID=2976332 RepID=UPI00226D37DA|nr:hypothetical protein [Campylobacter sp. MG1]
MKKILILLCFAFNLLAIDLEILKEYSDNYIDALHSFLHKCKYKPNIATNCDKKDEFVKYFKDECEKGNGEFCSAIGKIYKDELIKSDDKIKDSINYYKKACNLKVATSCYIIGTTYEIMNLDSNNDEEKKSLLKNAMEYYKKSCDLGFKFSCTQIQTIEKEQKQEKNSKYYYIALFIIVIFLIRMFFKNKSKNM